MPIAEIDGARIRYELGGEGPPAVLTPGGRLGLDDLSAFAGELRPHLRLLEWDRRNTGRSDLWLRDTSEQERWADDLAALLGQLGMAPAWLVGGSAGARVSYLTAVRHPEVVRGIVVWSVSGGPYGSQSLGYDYHVPYVNAALRGGMAAVAETPFFAARIRENAANGEALLATDPRDFVRAVLRWNDDYVPRDDMPAIAVTSDQLRSIACPTLVFEGNDLIHPAAPARAMHELVDGSVLAPSPWTAEEFMDRYVGKVAEPVMALYSRLTPTVLSFVAEAETRVGAPG